MTLNWHEKHLAELPFGDRFAKMVADFVGSWTFLIIHVVWFGAWILLRVEVFPYAFLTTIVSLEAIFLTMFVLMSQNRQTERDRAEAEADYETNVKAKAEVDEVQERLARIEDEKLKRILTLLEERR